MSISKKRTSFNFPKICRPTYTWSPPPNMDRIKCLFINIRFFFCFLFYYESLVKRTSCFINLYVSPLAPLLCLHIVVNFAVFAYFFSPGFLPFFSYFRRIFNFPKEMATKERKRRGKWDTYKAEEAPSLYSGNADKETSSGNAGLFSWKFSN